MSVMKRWLRRGVATLFVLALFVVGAFGILQTSLGREWLVAIIDRTMSGPGSSVTIVGLGGVIPFDIHAARIEVADDRGAWLTVDHPRLDLSVTGLLTGDVHIRALTASAIEIARPPDTSAAPTAPTSLSERLRLPHVPAGIAVDRITVERLTLGPAVLGEPVEATLTGNASLAAGSARIAVDLRRTDGQPGNVDLVAALAGAPPMLSLRLTADEPTGVLLDRVLHRDDRLALAVLFTGEGPLSQWRGRLMAAAGSLARLDCDVTLAGGPDTAATIDGTASVVPLLPTSVASVVGGKVPLHLRATFAESGLVALNEMSVGLAAGNVTGEGSFGGLDRRLAARVQANFPNLALLTGVAGLSLAGSAEVTATLSGSELRPAFVINALGDGLQFGTTGAQHAEAHLTVSPTGNLDQPTAGIAILGVGRAQGTLVPDDLVPARLGRDLDWSFKAQASLDDYAIELADLTVRGIGVDISGSGRFGPGPQVRDGRLHFAVADLRPLAPVLGLPVAGMLKLDATQAELPGVTSIQLNGSTAGLRTGVAAIDALTEGSVVISGTVGQDSASAWVLDRLALSTAKASLTGNGKFDPVAKQLSATVSIEIPSLQPLGMAGRAAGHLTIEGGLDHSKLTAQLGVGDVRVGGARLDQFQLDATLSDIGAAQGKIDGRFRSGDLSGTLTLDVDARNPAELVIPRFRVQAADGSAEGSFRIDRGTLLTRGTLSARIPNLTRWSALAGLQLGGSVDLKAELERGGGQNLDLTASADRLSFGHLGLGHLAVLGHLTDALGAPAGKVQTKLTAFSLGSGRVDEANLSLSSTGPGRFTVIADAKGRFVDPLAFTSRGEYEAAPHGGGMTLRIVSFAGSVGSDRVQLTAPLALSRHGDDVSLSNLALTLGSGQISGSAALRGRALSGRLTAKTLPVALAARLAGNKSAAGTVSLDASFAGTAAAPTGHFVLSGRGLTAAHAGQRVPNLDVDATGEWNGRELDLKGKLGGLKGESLTFSGSLPMVFTAAPLSVTIPPSGRLALKLNGNGDLGNISDLLPIGEDRVSGHFTLDAGVTGSPAAPAASGRLTITGGRYESFATGAVLTNLKADFVGDRDRFTLHELTASDSANGSLTARGSVALGGFSGQVVEFTAKLSSFRIAAHDIAVVTATGAVAISGSVTAPKITGQLTVDRADCAIPDSLPPSVTRLNVVELNGLKTRGSPQPPAQTPTAPFAAPLDIQITLPRQTFVRGHGLDSEWRGQLKIGGTSAAPSITGSLESIRGTFDILGKTFRVAHSVIAFDGGPTLDPRLDIIAEVAAADITAQAQVAGVASAPTVSLSSTPSVPQDEILSRVLFGRGLGQITAGEGLQVAQAAATLAGGGPGMLDKLRTGLGLDRLSFGAAATGPASSDLNPAAGGNATGSPAVSGGKYVAKGVFVGVSQGTTPSTNKVTVEVDIISHVTVETERSQSGGTGLGLNYKYDY